ncbi:hypothetical protein LK511_05845 [Faecalicatena orotica]|nr:hypothetical protein [Faecalicatena orotica]
MAEKDKESIRNRFCDFLLQEQEENGDILTQYFHEFILSIETDKEKMEILNIIKEGTLLYEGIRYSSNINESGSWKTYLNIILDTEVLFAVGGYNSAMYQEMYQELEKYLKEINKGCPVNAPKIKLSYFSETKQEIDAYFESAKRIMKKQDVPDPTKEAMQQIVNNCKTVSDIESKRILFYKKLRDKNIWMIERDFYEKGISDNLSYNLEDKAIIETYAAQWGEKEDNVYRSLKCLSHINILRKGENYCGFEKCGFIFLTATGRTLKLAGVSELGGEGKVPLATTFDFLINRFWFKLNKGFGINKTPRTLDMVMRSRHLLSAILKAKTSQVYDEVKKKYEDGELTKQEFVALNNELREQLKVPTEIDIDTIGEEINDLEHWNLEKEKEEFHRKEEQLKLEQNRAQELSKRLEEAQKDLFSVEKLLDTERKERETDRKKAEEAFKSQAMQYAEMKNKLDTEIQIREEREEKDKKRKKKIYGILRNTLIVLAVFFVGIYIYGEVKGYLWTKIVAGVFEVSAVLPGIMFVVKKLKV